MKKILMFDSNDWVFYRRLEQHLYIFKIFRFVLVVNKVPLHVLYYGWMLNYKFSWHKRILSKEWAFWVLEEI